MDPTTFAGLAESDQVAALQELAVHALGVWDLAAPTLELIKYRENAVFAVRTRDGVRRVARVHRPGYRTDLDIQCEFDWMAHLRAEGIATPVPVATRDGRFVETATAARVPEPRQCVLMEWIDGASPGTLEGGVFGSEEELLSLYRSVGEVAARMHDLAMRWSRPKRFSRPSWNSQTLIGETPTFGRFEELEVVTPEQLAVLVPARDLARRRLAELGGAEMLIHGDLVPDNILIHQGQQRIIDFDDFGWSWVGFEMATSLFPLQLSGGFDTGLAGYLEGYRSVRAFPPEELEALPEMMLARALSYLGWPVGRPEIASARDLAPMFAALMTESAAEYLSARG